MRFLWNREEVSSAGQSSVCGGHRAVVIGEHLLTLTERVARNEARLGNINAKARASIGLYHLWIRALHPHDGCRGNLHDRHKGQPHSRDHYILRLLPHGHDRRYKPGLLGHASASFAVGRILHAVLTGIGPRRRLPLLLRMVRDVSSKFKQDIPLLLESKTGSAVHPADSHCNPCSFAQNGNSSLKRHCPHSSSPKISFD